MKSRQGRSGVVVVDKPAGPTSHDLVARARRMLKGKIGHTGTLDPAATGVLPLMLGKATRLMQFFQRSDKVYQAQIHLGVETDTYDQDGEVLRERQPPQLTREMIQQCLARFTGDLRQIPPMYSAVRVGGERLYKAARRGEEKPRQARPVVISRIELLEVQPPLWTVRITCSAGTYVRALAHDIGQEVGCGAHLARLRRERSGQFDLQMAVDPEWPADEWVSRIIPLEELLPDFPRLDLEAPDALRVRHGNPLLRPPGWPEGICRLFAEDGLLAIARAESASIQPFVVLATDGD